MLDFSFAKGNEELQERAPLFYSVLVAGGSNKKTEKKKTRGFQQLEWLLQSCSETDHHV